MADEYVTQATYARMRRVSRMAVNHRTMTLGGPVPVYGPKKLIRVAEANALWDATMAPNGAANAKPAPDVPPPTVTGSQLAQARAAALVVDVQTKRLVLEQRRGALVSRDRAVLKAFSFARTIRDAIQAWAARVGPQLAAAFDLDTSAVTIYLEDNVRQLLTELASERVDF